MPIYEYRCGDCGHEFETIQKISDEPLRTCPACHEDALVKKVSAAAFRLKGGGWYETDFKSGSKRNVAADAESAAGADGGGKSESGNGADSGSKADKGTKAESKSESGGTKTASDTSVKKSDGS
ncbi:MAG: zinc ribbon domain-containing protein [Gammaproteobacteria bacterium]|jgi:putative FmdB family regulatory protein